MSADEIGKELGRKAIEHFSNPSDTAAEERIQKILDETNSQNIKQILSVAKQNSGKVDITPLADKNNNVVAVDFNFHPLWSLYKPGKDLHIELKK